MFEKFKNRIKTSLIYQRFEYYLNRSITCLIGIAIIFLIVFLIFFIKGMIQKFNEKDLLTGLAFLIGFISILVSYAVLFKQLSLKIKDSLDKIRDLKTELKNLPMIIFQITVWIDYLQILTETDWKQSIKNDDSLPEGYNILEARKKFKTRPHLYYMIGTSTSIYLDKARIEAKMLDQKFSEKFLNNYRNTIKYIIKHSNRKFTHNKEKEILRLLLKQAGWIWIGYQTQEKSLCNFAKKLEKVNKESIWVCIKEKLLDMKKATYANQTKKFANHLQDFKYIKQLNFDLIGFEMSFDSIINKLVKYSANNKDKLSKDAEIKSKIEKIIWKTKKLLVGVLIDSKNELEHSFLNERYKMISEFLHYSLDLIAEIKEHCDYLINSLK